MKCNPKSIGVTLHQCGGVAGVKWRLKIVPIAFTTDFEAQGTFGFESISAGAHMFCRVCTFNESVDDAYTAATDFLTTPSWTKRRGKRPRVHCPWAERTADEVQRQMEELADLDETAAKKFSTDTGIFSSTAPLLPEVVPGFNIVTMRPQDIMHLEACGILLLEASSIVHRLTKVLKVTRGGKSVPKFTVKQLNGWLARCALTLNQSRGASFGSDRVPLRCWYSLKEQSAAVIDLPDFHPSITESDEDGNAKNKLRLKAAQVHTFVRISEDLIGRHLGEHVDDVGWQCWLAHAKYFNSMMVSSFTIESINELNQQINTHQELFATMQGHFIPKHHFARHVPKDIIRSGPPRLYWCFPFEAYLRKAKKWAAHSNRKDELMHIATMLSLEKALVLTADP